MPRAWSSAAAAPRGGKPPRALAAPVDVEEAAAAPAPPPPLPVESAWRDFLEHLFARGYFALASAEEEEGGSAQAGAPLSSSGLVRRFGSAGDHKRAVLAWSREREALLRLLPAASLRDLATAPLPAAVLDSTFGGRKTLNALLRLRDELRVAPTEVGPGCASASRTKAAAQGRATLADALRLVLAVCTTGGGREAAAAGAWGGGHSRPAAVADLLSACCHGPLSEPQRGGDTRTDAERVEEEERVGALARRAAAARETRGGDAAPPARLSTPPARPAPPPQSPPPLRRAVDAAAAASEASLSSFRSKRSLGPVRRDRMRVLDDDGGVTEKVILRRAYDTGKLHAAKPRGEEELQVQKQKAQRARLLSDADDNNTGAGAGGAGAAPAAPAAGRWAGL